MNSNSFLSISALQERGMMVAQGLRAFRLFDLSLPCPTGISFGQCGWEGAT